MIYNPFPYFISVGEQCHPEAEYAGQVLWREGNESQPLGKLRFVHWIWLQETRRKQFRWNSERDISLRYKSNEDQALSMLYKTIFNSFRDHSVSIQYWQVNIDTSLTGYSYENMCASQEITGLWVKPYAEFMDIFRSLWRWHMFSLGYITFKCYNFCLWKNIKESLQACSNLYNWSDWEFHYANTAIEWLMT